MDYDRVKGWVLVFGFAALLSAVFYLGFQIGQKHPLKLDSAGLSVRVDTLTIRDTIRLEKPVFVTKYVDRVELVPVTDTIRLRDTLYVAQEREVKGYEGEDYRAQVSGIRPALDWVEVYPKTTIVRETIEVPGPQRWKRVGLGIAAGPGVFWDGSDVKPGAGIVAGVRINF